MPIGYRSGFNAFLVYETDVGIWTVKFVDFLERNGCPGDVLRFRLKAGDLSQTVLYRTEMGLGRIALRPSTEGRPIVLYVTCDDGRIVRLEQLDGDDFTAEVIYRGPQGLRGIAAGRFDALPDSETIAVFGYSKNVDLLVRFPDGWRRETVFTDVDRGHWLARGEVDGRNTTEELILSGYGKRVVLLSRPAWIPTCVELIRSHN